MSHPVHVEVTAADGTRGFRAWLGTETDVFHGIVGEEKGPNSTVTGAMRALAQGLGDALDAKDAPPAPPVE